MPNYDVNTSNKTKMSKRSNTSKMFKICEMSKISKMSKMSKISQVPIKSLSDLQMIPGRSQAYLQRSKEDPPKIPRRFQEFSQKIPL